MPSKWKFQRELRALKAELGKAHVQALPWVHLVCAAHLFYSHLFQIRWSTVLTHDLLCQALLGQESPGKDSVIEARHRKDF